MTAPATGTAIEFAPLPEGAAPSQRVPLELLEQLIRPETAHQVRWARFIDGGRVDIAMPQGCRLIVPADPAALTAALRPAYQILARAAAA